MEPMSYFAREQPTLAPEFIDWEECDCLLCGGRQWTPLVEAPDRFRTGGRWFLVVQCNDCGLCFTNPRPSPESIGRFYQPDYPSHRAPTKPDVPGKWRPNWFGQARLRKNMPLHGQGRLLDFGCGSGSYLMRMHRQGWQVTGVDQSAQAVRCVREDLGLPALVGSLPHPQLEPGSFDVITMWQSLEHVHWPADVLQSARRLLAPGGKLVIAVPNIDSLPFRWFGQTWNGLDLPRHLTHFAPWTLRLMLHRTGFRPGAVRMVRRSGWLRSSAQLACRQVPAAPRLYRWLRGRTTSNLASWYSFLTRQSDCMMVTATNFR
jgi:SAM-dependent methyltransferase